MLLKTTDFHPLAKIEERTAGEIARAMSGNPPYPAGYPFLPPSKANQKATERLADVRKLLAKQKEEGKSRTSSKGMKSRGLPPTPPKHAPGAWGGLEEARKLIASQMEGQRRMNGSETRPRKVRCPSSSVSSVSSDSSLGSLPMSSRPQDPYPPSLPSPLPRHHPRSHYTRHLEPSPDQSSPSPSPTHASRRPFQPKLDKGDHERKAHRPSPRRDRSCTPMDEVFVQDITWPPFPEWPKDVSKDEEMKFIEGEIELYRIREAYERSVGRRLVASYRKKVLMYERDVLTCKLSGTGKKRRMGR